MLEVEFRGKRIDNGGWIYGYYLKDEMTDQAFIFPFGNSVNESDKVGEEGLLQFFAFEVDPETVGQYTGLRELRKDGKKIFEGDIVQGFGRLFVVKFDVVERYVKSDDGEANLVQIPSFYFEYKGNALYPIKENYEGKNDLEDLRVVGNIHDNPELLKE